MRCLFAHKPIVAKDFTNDRVGKPDVHFLRSGNGVGEVALGGSPHPRPRTFAEANYISSIGLAAPCWRALRVLHFYDSA